MRRVVELEEKQWKMLLEIDLRYHKVTWPNVTPVTGVTLAIRFFVLSEKCWRLLREAEGRRLKSGPKPPRLTVMKQCFNKDVITDSLVELNFRFLSETALW